MDDEWYICDYDSTTHYRTPPTKYRGVAYAEKAAIDYFKALLETDAKYVEDPYRISGNIRCRAIKLRDDVK